ncbi:TWS1 protein precursor [Trifolium repens]|nr:TWS1 protein precursor [Trifolium repens]
MALMVTATVADPMPPPSGATSTRQMAADPTTNLFISDLVNSRRGDKTTPIAINRKLKENVHRIESNERVNIGDQVTLEDYNPIDPSPDVAKNVNPGPIQHGTPLMPFIPKPSPPSPSKPGEDDYD